MDSRELRRSIMSAFEPSEPPSVQAYVDCQSVRGEWDVVEELGSKIVDSPRYTCCLFTGYRGSGKSTELTCRLNEYLEQEGFFVVYFAADVSDVEPGDVQYVDILLSCVRHLVEAVQIENEDNPLVVWLEKRWDWLKDFALTKMSFEDLKLEGSVIPQFAKITATLRTVPDKRREMRQKINEETPSLLTALNEFIDKAQQRLKSDNKAGIVLIVDNLDRIPCIEDGEKKNCRDIFINCSTVMRGLNCHVIYTFPIAMAYSSVAAELRENYDQPVMLPIIMVRNPNGSTNVTGLDKMRSLVSQRLNLIDPRLVTNMESAQVDFPQVFENSDALNNLCLMSGGRVRLLMQLIQSAMKYNNRQVTITEAAVQRAVEEAKGVCANGIIRSDIDPWIALAKIASGIKPIINTPESFELLRNGYLLEYRYYDANSDLIKWQAVHPLVANCRQFREALSKIGENGQ
jgi:AAA ATPase domain